MADDQENSGSRLPVTFKAVDKTYQKPARRNELVSSSKYDKVDAVALEHVKLATNGVTYVSQKGMSGLFQVTSGKAAYIYANQVPDRSKRSDGDERLVESSALVALLDKKAQESPNADTQALYQYGRDTLINIGDSPQAEALRRQRDTFTDRELPKLRAARNATHDEVTGEPLRTGAAFHHLNPRELHTDPEDALNPSKGRVVNMDTHQEIHRNNVLDEKQFEEFRAKKMGERP